ncbi:MAG: hypothetical protein ACOH1Y_15820 [Propionicimonas sp.]
MATTATVLVIETKNDTLVSIHSDEAAAAVAAVAFVDENWAEEMGDTPRPADDSQALDMYFEEMLGTESWSTFEAALPQS